MLRELLNLFRSDNAIARMGQDFSTLVGLSYALAVRAGAIFFEETAPGDYQEGEVARSDRQINKLERSIRKQVIAHLTLASDPADVPYCLLLMGIVKDVERVGDYAKSLYDIARWGADFSAAPDRAQLEQHRDTVGALLDEAAAVFESRDVARAQELVLQADGYLDGYDDQVRESARSDGIALDAVTRALFSFYLGRITAHVMNLMTSLVLPVDQLDYYDEARDDRTDL
jgi:phosphate uptake regulator